MSATQTPTPETQNARGDVRYTPGGDYLWESSPDGDYVRYDDMEQAERQRDEARRDYQLLEASYKTLFAEAEARKQTEEYYRNLSGARFDEINRMKAEAEDLRKQITSLESQRESWRISSVCRELRSELVASQAQVLAFREALGVVLLSASPHPVENPSMWNAFQSASKVLVAAPPPVISLAEHQTAVDALQELHDWQNGPPLETEKWLKGWGDAMKLAEAALAAHKARVSPKEVAG